MSSVRDCDARHRAAGRSSARFEKRPRIALLGTAEDAPEEWPRAG
ncbi:hypothetical protein [Streptomyces sp. NRRL F-5727]|nr:hypothetical protein [Streptomyces sp. NRRL F-5727]